MTYKNLFKKNIYIYYKNMWIRTFINLLLITSVFGRKLVHENPDTQYNPATWGPKEIGGDPATWGPKEIGGDPATWGPK